MTMSSLFCQNLRAHLFRRVWKRTVMKYSRCSSAPHLLCLSVDNHLSCNNTEELTEKKSNRHEATMKQFEREFSEISQVLHTLINYTWVHTCDNRVYLLGFQVYEDQARIVGLELLTCLQEVDLRLDVLKDRMEHLEPVSLQVFSNTTVIRDSWTPGTWSHVCSGGVCSLGGGAGGGEDEEDWDEGAWRQNDSVWEWTNQPGETGVHAFIVRSHDGPSNIPILNMCVHLLWSRSDLLSRSAAAYCRRSVSYLHLMFSDWSTMRPW